MSIRSLLVLGTLGAQALASPARGGKTVTETETIEIFKYHTKTKTKTKTMTVTAPCTASSYSSSSMTSMSSMPSSSSSSSMSSMPSSYSSSSMTSSMPSPPGYSSSTMSMTSMTSMTTSTSMMTTASSTVTNATTTLLATATATSCGLNDAAKALGKLWFGTAIDYPGTGEATDQYYLAAFNNTKDFGEATPANIMKFEQTEPEQGTFDFSGGDQFLDLIEGTGKLARCHNLIWKSELPTWVTNPTVNWTNATLIPVLQNHVTSLVEYWGDRCYSWDVVNEAFADNPAGAYDPTSIWFQVIGPEYVPLAFAAAQAAVKKNNLKVKLFYNDYNIESPGAKTTAALNLVKELKSRGIQIDGVGLESHFIAGETPSEADQTTTKQAFAALGVDVAITELDVRLNLPPTAATEAQQVADYYSSVASCVNVDACIGVTVWDFDDTYSWVPGTFPGQGYADIMLQPGGADTPLVKKASYDGCWEALNRQPENSP